MSLTKDKFRKKCLEQLRNLPLHNKLYRDSLVNKKILEHLKDVRGKNILLYFPLIMEVDIRKVILKLRKTNDVYLPFMEQQSFKVVKYRLPLHKKKFNIFEAANSLKKTNTIDIAIVPTVGVDKNYQRVGFGKGMYDRFFAKLQKKPYTIFVQADTCYTREKVCDTYDISCDIYITSQTKNKNNILGFKNVNRSTNWWWNCHS